MKSVFEFKNIILNWQISVDLINEVPCIQVLNLEESSTAGVEVVTPTVGLNERLSAVVLNIESSTDGGGLDFLLTVDWECQIVSFLHF